MGNWMIIPNNTDLLHHGRLGQKWGERNGPPYPLNVSNKAYKKIQKTVSRVADLGDKYLAMKDKKTEKKEQKKTQKKMKKELKKKEGIDRAKKKAVSHNSYRELYAIKDSLTTQELRDAKDRIRLEQEIFNLAYPPKETFRKYMSRWRDRLNDLNNWYKVGKSAYNNIVEVHNTTDSGIKKPWRKIGEKYKDDDDKDKS